MNITSLCGSPQPAIKKHTAPPKEETDNWEAHITEFPHILGMFNVKNDEDLKKQIAILKTVKKISG